MADDRYARDFNAIWVMKNFMNLINISHCNLIRHEISVALRALIRSTLIKPRGFAWLCNLNNNKKIFYCQRQWKKKKVERAKLLHLTCHIIHFIWRPSGASRRKPRDDFDLLSASSISFVKSFLFSNVVRLKKIDRDLPILESSSFRLVSLAVRFGA